MINKSQSPSTDIEVWKDIEGVEIKPGQRVIYYRTNGGMSDMDIYEYKGVLYGAGPFNLHTLKEYAEALDFAGFEIVPNESQSPAESQGKEAKEEKSADLGECHECHKRPAVKDYNGHGYLVCERCYETLSNEFDEEYK